MKSIFREVRRKDRIWDEAAAWALLETGEYGFLSMSGTNGYAYGIPISYVLSGRRLYLHCAPQGYKLECLAENDRVCFCVVGPTRVIPADFTTAYRSAMVFGRMTGVLSDTERHHALELLADKYCPDYKAVSGAYIARSFHRTHVLRLDIEHISGKCKRMKKEG